MSDVESAFFAVKICNKCKDTKICGDTCVKCRLDKVVDAKIKMNLELVNEIKNLKAQVEMLENEVALIAQEGGRSGDKLYGNRIAWVALEKLKGMRGSDE